MIFPHQPEKVYTVGAAGYWLDRFHSEDRARREKLKRLMKKLARRNVRAIASQNQTITEATGTI